MVFSLKKWLRTVPSPLSKSQPTPQLLLDPETEAYHQTGIDQTLNKLHLEDSDGEDEGRAVMSATDSAFGVEEIGRIDFIAFLPAELAVKVLSFVDQIEELKVLSIVSKTWYSLAQDNEVWKAHFFARWGRPKAIQKAPFVPRNWRALYESRLMLNAQWKSSSPVTPSVIEGHTDAVYCIQYDAAQIVSGSRDRTIKIWSFDTHRCLKTFTGHTQSVLCLQYNSKYLVTGSSDASIIVWDIHTGAIIHRLTGHAMSVLDVKFNNNVIVSCSKDCTIKIWDIKTGQLLKSLEGHKAAVNAVHLHGEYITSASGDCNVRLWHLKTGAFIREFIGHTRGLACVQHDENVVISGSNDKTIRVWDLHRGNCVRVLEGHQDLVRTLCFDNERLVSGSYDCSIKVWDLKTGKVVRDIEQAHASWVFHVQIDGSKIVSAGQDKTIAIFDFSKAVANATQIV